MGGSGASQLSDLDPSLCFTHEAYSPYNIISSQTKPHKVRPDLGSHVRGLILFRGINFAISSTNKLT